MRVLVTGANGFIGQGVCTHLVGKGYEVVAVVRSKISVEQLAVGGIGPETDWQAALHGVKAIVHLAARVHVMRDAAHEPLAEFRRVNVDGTLKLARKAAAAGVRRFVFISSIGVNGNRTVRQPFTEVDEPCPHDFYSISKYEAEMGLCEIAKHTGMEVVIVRPPLVYGPRAPGNFRTLTRAVLKGLPLPFGAVHNRRSLVALDNLVDFVSLCLDHERSPRAANEVFLISDGEDVSTTELLRRVAQAYGVIPRLVPVPERWMRFAAGLLGKGAVADRLLGSLVVDISKARELLGWRPVVSMDEQLQKMVRHDALF